MSNILFKINTLKKTEITKHLNKCIGELFAESISKMYLNDLANKIYLNAITFEAWDKDKLVGMISAYINSRSKEGFINHVYVEKDYRRKGLSKILLSKCISYSDDKNFKTLSLEVSEYNYKAIKLYNFFNFNQVSKTKGKIKMIRRDYNKEFVDNEREYAYSFDFDVMHPFMLKSIEPFILKYNNTLELGSFKGDFTKRLVEFFDEIHCVEAASEAIEIAKRKVPRAIFYNESFENIKLNRKFENIIFTHVLEHLDNPVKILERINNEWLEEGGRLFLITPNAMAPSRQIAVKMNLISHNTAVTSSEKKHGHRITYTFDTLERDVKKSGLKIIFRSGIFFKALANFQWDQLLQTDIISNEYLEGCYELGQSYPELCSSIFLVCEKGDSII